MKKKTEKILYKIVWLSIAIPLILFLLTLIGVTNFRSVIIYFILLAFVVIVLCIVAEVSTYFSIVGEIFGSNKRRKSYSDETEKFRRKEVSAENRSKASSCIGNLVVTEDVKRRSEIGYKYSNNTYKAGTEIPAGEYYVDVLPNEKSGYYSVSFDVNNKDTFFHEKIRTHTFITVAEGQYVGLSNLFAVSVEETPNLAPKEGLCTSGVYRIGIDIPAGEYKLSSSKDKKFYYGIFKDSTYQDTVSNEMVHRGESTYVSVVNGQYLKLTLF